MTKHESSPLTPDQMDKWNKKNRKKPGVSDQPRVPLPEDDPDKKPEPNENPNTEKPNKIIRINPDGTVTEE